MTDPIAWHGVFPAITTPFTESLTLDRSALERHVTWLVDAGCTGIVALGSLGEAPTLSPQEKVAIVSIVSAAVGARVPVVAGISALTTPDAVALARAVERAGARGLMVLPPYVYRGDWRETRAHLSAIIDATPLPCMLYNNPVAYGTDIVPDQIAELAVRHENLHAVKESSTDPRRVTAIRATLGNRLAIFAGVDDAIVESIAVGATGWVAGLVNALPKESVDLFALACADRRAQARSLYEWFLPLLRMDTVPKFVQLIKLVQQEVGQGSERVRPPRLPLDGTERDGAVRAIRKTLANRPDLQGSAC